jgi:hypothetical protein
MCSQIKAAVPLAPQVHVCTWVLAAPRLQNSAEAAPRPRKVNAITRQRGAVTPEYSLLR